MALRAGGPSRRSLAVTNVTKAGEIHWEQHTVEWIDDNHLRIGDVSFRLFFASDAESPLPPNTYKLEKTRGVVEFYREKFAEADIKAMLEVGIRWGASAVLFHRMLRPAKLVAIDLSAAPVPALSEYIRICSAGAVLRPFFGIDQADRAALEQILANELGGAPLDLVIDDGCHFLSETRACFNTLFPHLRAGGAYAIEDWGWAHWPGIWQENGGPWSDKPALSQLVFELVMTAASRPDVIQSVEVRHDIALVYRGPAKLSADFDVSRSFLTAGRRFVEHSLAQTTSGRARARLARWLRSATGALRR